MPELPEVETVKRGLEKAIKGKKLADFESDWHKMTNKPAKQYQKILKGKQILDVRRRSKMLIIDLSAGWHILFHLKMTGQLVYRDKKHCLIGGHPIEKSCANLPSKFTHAIFTFSDKSHLYFNDVRKFGWARLYKSEELARVLTKLKLGPEPLAREFTVDYLLKALQRRSRSKIKQVIMNPEIVVGVGNIYSDETLFSAGVRPDRPAGKVKPDEARRIHDSIIRILKAAIKAQGTSFSNYVNSNGEAGAYTKQLKVYQRYGKKCCRCRGTVRKMKIGGRTASFCPKCQH
ncbi:MAG: bifunctional DNA-formamidopyrimidine glycosylase/DNA-(apurinic or apyrimidinic site) lyase [Candidatus Saganbacteria bacterium]|nr:bifunctional DNA-formamidopyrimidine glycosylase/DNA-(apurinic or apyrimidinic site) lyase [Candidatus Saganbacteria bacterium]